MSAKCSETDLLPREENVGGLAGLHRELLAQVERVRSPNQVVLDVDSSEGPVKRRSRVLTTDILGRVCYRSLILFKNQVDCLAAKL
jgi:hypothetical protein